jgi:hypothetical protein
MLFFNHCVTQLEENKFQMLKIKKVIRAKARVKKLVVVQLPKIGSTSTNTNKLVCSNSPTHQLITVKFQY